MRHPRQLVHTEWFDYGLQKLGSLPGIENLLAEDLYRIALHAELIPCAPGASELRIFQTRNFLREDGHLICLLVYFVLRSDDSVELQHIESVEADMQG